MIRLFHHTLTHSPRANSQLPALIYKDKTLNYPCLIKAVSECALGLNKLGLTKGERVAIYLPKQIETIVSIYGVSMAGGVFVPVNPILKSPQVKHILNDCEVSILITSKNRLSQLKDSLGDCPSIKTVILVEDSDFSVSNIQVVHWSELSKASTNEHLDNFPNIISSDIAAILYTSGSTGAPKGVVLSHKNLIAGAQSVSLYLENAPSDRILAVLPLSFDYGLSQITTGFLSDATVVLMEYLLPRDVVKAVEKYEITGLAAVPPLWVQLAELDWPESARQSLRYITNSGGALPTSTLNKLRNKLPDTLPYLMYGLTEAFRSTFLPPQEIDNRPQSIGKAIPDAEILVLNKNGEHCKPFEHGELVHRGPHVAMGYWNSPAKTAERFKPLTFHDRSGLTQEIAVFSGDTVYGDNDGYLYFVGRTDDMIKTSGYRVSPSELEDSLYHLDEIAEVAAIGVPHQQLGQAIILVIKPNELETVFKVQPLNDSKLTDSIKLLNSKILSYCKQQLPNFMQPQAIELMSQLPRNNNGKIDRARLTEHFKEKFS